MLNYKTERQSPGIKFQTKTSIKYHLKPQHSQSSAFLLNCPSSISKRIIKTDLRDSQKRFQQTCKLKKLSSLETMEATGFENMFTTKKDLYLKQQIEDDLQRKLQPDCEQEGTLSKQQREELDYVTFRMVKQEQKISRSRFTNDFLLRDRQPSQQ